ncbi:MAG TPA: carboxypeptidase regulatory-like domain-containing protein [Gemmatimonadales bacterium]|nr:carboxypeptidase regulatory-like domain-containing protein [Gemmatimonadales bacterium]
MNLSRIPGPLRASAVLTCAVLAVLFLAPARASAQGVSGQLRDSLVVGGPLANATLLLDGTPTRVRTDGYGRFRLDSVPAGTHTLGFTHPAFTEAGVPAPRWKLDVPAVGLANLLLATPSADSRYGRACAAEPRTPGTGYFVGTVRDAASDSGLAGVVVNAIWSEITVSKSEGVRTSRHSARAQTNAQGQFVVCRVPNDGEVTVWAARNGISTGLITLDLAGRPLAAREFTLGTRPLAAAATAADTARLTGRLDGMVKNIDGAPIADARVYVRGSRAVARTTATGAFSLAGLPAGTQTVEASALGYQPGTLAIDLKPGGVSRTEVVLGKSVQQLPSLAVIGKMPSGSGISSFDERMKRGIGTFITEDDIERRNPLIFEDIFRGIPGVQVEPVGNGYRLFSSRGAIDAQGECSPQYYVDGVPMTVDPTDDAPFPVDPRDIVGIEVYSGASTTPAEFQRAMSGCGAVVIWTKRGGSRPRPASR